MNKENSAYSIYCNSRTEYFRRICELTDLIPIKILVEKYDSDNVCTDREIIYRCRVCGGYHKREYSAIYYPSGLFDTEEGWWTEDKYFKIEEPLWLNGSPSCTIPLPLDQARSYGYTGADFTWKNKRCNFPLINVDLTCRMNDLDFIAYLAPEKKDHHNERFYQCRRCGEWYLFKILPVYTEAYLKPTSEHFPLEAARALPVTAEPGRSNDYE